MSEDYRIVARDHGGPEMLTEEAVRLAPPGSGEVQVRQRAVGLNFIDTYHRSGLYPSPVRPVPLGGEAAGVVEAVGPDVTGFAPGDRVAYATAPTGAYASARNVPARHLIHLPDGIDMDTAAAAMLKGLTAAFLIGPCGKIDRGMTVLVHAAAGGVGSILVPWAAAIGARVIGHVGDAAKAARVEALGAERVLSGPLDTLAEQVRDLTDGRGAEVVLDGVGAASWAASLAATAKRGLIVTYGNASGAVPPFSALDLLRAGSLFVTRPSLFDYAATRAELQALADALFARLADGSVPIEIAQRFALRDVAEAHRALEARRTVGSTVLLP
ncbi:MAG: quinone oxidoreductase [Sphingomonas fennica]